MYQPGDEVRIVKQHTYQGRITHAHRVGEVGVVVDDVVDQEGRKNNENGIILVETHAKFWIDVGCVEPVLPEVTDAEVQAAIASIAVRSL